ncbi:MAG: hypothetical protein ACI9G1_000790 [Pirellulaceae bacterium]
MSYLELVISYCVQSYFSIVRRARSFNIATNIIGRVGEASRTGSNVELLRRYTPHAY